MPAKGEGLLDMFSRSSSHNFLASAFLVFIFHHLDYKITIRHTRCQGGKWKRVCEKFMGKHFSKGVIARPVCVRTRTGRLDRAIQGMQDKAKQKSGLLTLKRRTGCGLFFMKGYEVTLD